MHTQIAQLMIALLAVRAAPGDDVLAEEWRGWGQRPAPGYEPLRGLRALTGCGPTERLLGPDWRRHRETAPHRGDSLGYVVSRLLSGYSREGVVDALPWFRRTVYEARDARRLEMERLVSAATWLDAEAA